MRNEYKKPSAMLTAINVSDVLTTSPLTYSDKENATFDERDVHSLSEFFKN